MSLIKYTAMTLALTLAAPTMVSAEENVSHRTTPSELKWIQAPFGPLVSPVLGDFSSGQHITYVKFTAGMITPPHTHSHDYTGIVISGVARHFVPGKESTRTKLPSGSHWFIPGGLEHVSECLPGADCVMALFQKEKFDFLPAE